MKRFAHPRRGLAAIVLAALAVAVPVAQAAPEAPTAPDRIAVPDGHKPFLFAGAVGVQIYTCIATADGRAWRFGGPRATLFDDRGHLLASHFAGPSWQTRDGSTVMAALDGDASVTVDPTAVPWLRLRVTSVTAGADGDRLAATTYIQRLDTTGGLAPAASTCTAETVGRVAEVPYTAVYAFWKATGN